MVTVPWEASAVKVFSAIMGLPAASVRMSPVCASASLACKVYSRPFTTCEKLTVSFTAASPQGRYLSPSAASAATVWISASGSSKVPRSSVLLSRVTLTCVATST